MGRSKAATPAGRSRSTAGRRSRSAGRAATKPRPKPKRAATAKRAAAKRTAPGRATSTANGRGATRKPPRRRPPSKSRARRPRPARAPRRSLGAWRRQIPWRTRIVIAAVVAVALGAGYLFWLRDSSLVAVTNVQVKGVTAGDTEQITGQLERSAEGMTTLHVRADELEKVAAAFPTVESVDVDASFPHSMTIDVQERPPAMIARAGDEEVPVAADGTLLTGVEAPKDGLPVLEVPELPTSPRLVGEPLKQALVLGAAPEPLRPLIERVELSKDFGVEVTLRGEIPIRFGGASSAAQKWAAAAAVLADPHLDALTYLDVRVPQRPAVGGNG